MCNVRCTGDSVNVKLGHCFFSGYQPALHAEFGKFDDFVWKKATVYSDSFNGHLYKTDISVKRTLRVGPCLSLLPLFDSLTDTSVKLTPRVGLCLSLFPLFDSL